MESPRSRLVTWSCAHLSFLGRRFWRPHPDLDRSATPALPPGGGRPFSGAVRRARLPSVNLATARMLPAPGPKPPDLGNSAPQASFPPPHQRGRRAERINRPLPRVGTWSTPGSRSPARNATSVVASLTSAPATTFTRATMLRDHGD